MTRRPSGPPFGAALLFTALCQTAPAQAAAQVPIAELGAATFVPADCTMYFGSLRLDEQWRAVADSRAFARLMALPGVTLARSAIEASPGWRAFEALRDDSEEFDAAVELLGDALAQEVFVCLDARGKEALPQIAAGYLQATAAKLTGGDEAARLVMLDAILELEVPAVLLGCRLSEPARAERLLQFVVDAAAEVLPVPVETEQVGGGTFRVLRLDASLLPEGGREGVRQALRRIDVDRARITAVDDWLDEHALTIAVGLRGDYLLLGIGPDTRLLQQLGATAALADSDALEPVREVLKPGAAALSYVCAELSQRQPIPVELGDWIVGAVAASTSLPEGLLPRLTEDVRDLLTESASAYGNMRAETTVSFLNRGVETFAFRAEMPGRIDATKSLATLKNAGTTPLLCYASRAPSQVHAYERLLYWVQRGYGYFTDFVVPRLGPGDRADHERFRADVLPFLAELDEITRRDLLPNVDNGETMYLLDGGGELARVPGLPPLQRALRFPRPALVQQLRDGKAFDRGLQATYKAFERLLRRSSGNADLRLPMLAGVWLEAGLCYSWPVPPIGIEPTLLIADEALAFGLFEQATRELLEEDWRPESGVVDLDEPAGEVLFVDLAGLSTLLFDDVESVIDALRAAGVGERTMLDAVRAHLPGLRAAVSALRSYTSRTWNRDGYEVTHSWMQVEDPPK